MSNPACRAAFHSLRAPYTEQFSSHSATSRRVNSASRTPRGEGRTRLRGLVGARGHPQHAADGLHPERDTVDDVGAVGFDERDYLRCWRSSSAVKKLAAWRTH